MATKKKGNESSINEDIINRVHLTLAEEKTGNEIIEFLRATEPVFMNEVNRFVNTEMSRMRYQITETQAMYMGSVIGAAYISGFLIAREAGHRIFDGAFTFKSDIKEALSSEEFDKICDIKRKDGRNYKDIAKSVRDMLSGKTKIPKGKKKAIEKTDGKRLDIGNLE